MNLDNNQLESIFRKGRDEDWIEPSIRTWSRLEDKLDLESNKKRLITYKHVIGVAACLLMISFGALWYSNGGGQSNAFFANDITPMLMQDLAISDLTTTQINSEIVELHEAYSSCRLFY